MLQEYMQKVAETMVPKRKPSLKRVASFVRYCIRQQRRVHRVLSNMKYKEKCDYRQMLVVNGILTEEDLRGGGGGRQTVSGSEADMPPMVTLPPVGGRRMGQRQASSRMLRGNTRASISINAGTEPDAVEPGSGGFAAPNRRSMMNPLSHAPALGGNLADIWSAVQLVNNQYGQDSARKSTGRSKGVDGECLVEGAEEDKEEKEPTEEEQWHVYTDDELAEILAMTRTELQQRCVEQRTAQIEHEKQIKYYKFWGSFDAQSQRSLAKTLERTLFDIRCHVYVYRQGLDKYFLEKKTQLAKTLKSTSALSPLPSTDDGDSVTLSRMSSMEQEVSVTSRTVESIGYPMKPIDRFVTM